MRHTIGELVRLVIGEGAVLGLDGNPVGILIDLLLKTCRDRLLDLFPFKLDKCA
ncbi:MAG TPA: hypothetical protein VKK81_03280 [Candidatus Binatia bacterium]|nr:hypothetical protein [Candidatus Binatia bacterium]